MTDLREKISDLLHEWRSDIIDETVAYDWGCHAKKPASTYDIADRILALLPKVPELRWNENDRLLLGNLCIGCTSSFGEGSHQGYVVNTDETEWSEIVAEDEPTDQAARAAVEAAVRKALGWVE